MKQTLDMLDQMENHMTLFQEPVESHGAPLNLAFLRAQLVY